MGLQRRLGDSVVVRVLPTLAVLTAIAISGTVSGMWTHRWTSTTSLDAAAAAATHLPMTLGEWDGQSREVDERTLHVAGCAGIIHRQYVNRRTGDTVAFMLMCGSAGPVSVHTPDVCYLGAGFQEVGTVVRHTVKAPDDARFWVRRFQKQGPAPVQLRIFYAWNATGDWQAADKPRWAYAHRPLLYKLYVVRELPRTDEPLEKDPSVAFLQELLPQLKPFLFPAS